MDVYVQFWNVAKLKVSVQFIGSTFFGYGTNQNLLKHFHEVNKQGVGSIEIVSDINGCSKCKFNILQRNSSR